MLQTSQNKSLTSLPSRDAAAARSVAGTAWPVGSSTSSMKMAPPFFAAAQAASAAEGEKSGLSHRNY
jgi:hypothetical protein